jgi:nitrogen fixation protein FixH
MPTSIDTRPAATDLYLYAGDTATLSIDVTDDAGAPLDLTTYTAEAQIRATADASTAVDFTTAVASSTITLTLDAATAAALPPRGVWDVQITAATGEVTTLAGGKVTVTPEVTR